MNCICVCEKVFIVCNGSWQTIFLFAYIFLRNGGKTLKCVSDGGGFIKGYLGPVSLPVLT